MSKSRPSRTRGLKLLQVVDIWGELKSRPSRTRGLKPDVLISISIFTCRVPRGRVD